MNIATIIHSNIYCISINGSIAVNITIVTIYINAAMLVIDMSTLGNSYIGSSKYFFRIMCACTCRQTIYFVITGVKSILNTNKGTSILIVLNFTKCYIFRFINVAFRNILFTINKDIIEDDVGTFVNPLVSTSGTNNFNIIDN